MAPKSRVSAMNGCMTLLPRSVPAHRGFVQVDVHLLHLEIVVDPVQPELAAAAAHLHPTPRSLDVGGLHVIYPDDTGPQLPDHAEGAEDVARPHRASQTERGGIGNLDRLPLALERNHGNHRTEDLLLRDPHARIHAVENGGLDKQTARECAPRLAPTEHELRAFVLSLLNVTDHTIAMRSGDERTHPRVAIQR